MNTTSHTTPHTGAANHSDRTPNRAGWVPFDLVVRDRKASVQWRFIGDERPRRPFFEDAVRRRAPLAGSGVLHTSLEALDRPPAAQPLPLAGIIHHASRCGSTLLCSMLACSPRFTVLAEPPIIESLIDWSHRRGGEELNRLPARLAHALQWLRLRRRKEEERIILKTESQQILDRPLIASLHPEVPWIFLFRPPERILRSHRKQRGRQMVPRLIHPPRLGLTEQTLNCADLDGYCAHVTARTLAAAVRPLAARNGRSPGRAVHYQKLPSFAWEELDPLFALDLTKREIEAMRAITSRDAKSPHQPFVPRSDQPPALEAAPEVILEPPTVDALAQHYAALERLERVGVRSAHPILRATRSDRPT